MLPYWYEYIQTADKNCLFSWVHWWTNYDPPNVVDIMDDICEDLTNGELDEWLISAPC